MSRWRGSGVAALGAVGATVLVAVHAAGGPASTSTLVVLLTCCLALALTRGARVASAPWARASGLAALGLWAMVLVIWLLPVRSPSASCGTVLLPAQPWSAREGVCGWMTVQLYDATAPALILATVFAAASALGTWTGHRAAARRTTARMG
jgi:hypothetical protein